MVVKADEWCSRQPDGQRNAIAEDHTFNSLAKQSLPGRATLFDQLCEWIRVETEPASGSPIKDGDGQEGELTPRCEYIGGIEEQHNQPGEGKQVGDENLAAQQQSSAAGAHHDRGA